MGLKGRSILRSTNCHKKFHDRREKAVKEAEQNVLRMDIFQPKDKDLNNRRKRILETKRALSAPAKIPVSLRAKNVKLEKTEEKDFEIVINMNESMMKNLRRAKKRKTLKLKFKCGEDVQTFKFVK